MQFIIVIISVIHFIIQDCTVTDIFYTKLKKNPLSYFYKCTYNCSQFLHSPRERVQRSRCLVNCRCSLMIAIINVKSSEKCNIFYKLNNGARAPRGTSVSARLVFPSHFSFFNPRIVTSSIIMLLYETKRHFDIFIEKRRLNTKSRNMSLY